MSFFYTGVLAGDQRSILFCPFWIIHADSTFYADVHGPVVEESRIVPGDEVECKSPSDILVTIQVDYDGNWLTGLNKAGKMATYDIESCKKTGRHHDGYDTLIKQMRGE